MTTRPSGFSARSTAEQVTQGVDATGLTAIVTGASNGIGEQTARVLALRGVHVIMAVRNMDAGRAVKEKIVKKIPTAKIDVMEIDLSSLASVRKFASEYISLGLPLNILINNAGVLTLTSMVSKDNIELHFATNHLETMKKTVEESKREGRIINVTSSVHHLFKEKDFQNNSNKIWMSYQGSKLANILHANGLAKRLKEDGIKITANSVHPGLVQTNILLKKSFVQGILAILSKPFLKNAHQGAATTCYVAINEQVKGISGQYFEDCNIGKASLCASNYELAQKLWDYSFSLIHSN
ncbi:short-chain dehydrogenase TIC 32, chloroplastic-like isoform X2 [Euphorbia lathyris]|uniref:short-chain dehydrogenase TIC 32, chloroplastic-like isoform X2 n=1 Tax=Euphorbia lathyris TaxID=212925 RepID=UPI0033131586